MVTPTRVTASDPRSPRAVTSTVRLRHASQVKKSRSAVKPVSTAAA
jgi:hypothetical protein